ncbi:outer membrane porin, OprD family [Stutzerimonas kirkiae]|uniref:Outer membrane porin, OprD family n=2 Tax=Stutzerimonas kirkiae TaxID=2211392 RepID=A0A4Q9RC63_9GAMM|nr:outer membrane porin, OprD family [Stutzerimonas kirkiae]TBV04196.1 outer membrane porin, OprD family [Stutzerimonas kirkiae]TBV10900.1 outer membrane porin, OprD family [Stutzerimonas kirkiae]
MKDSTSALLLVATSLFPMLTLADEGFLADSSLNILNRNFYWSNDFRNGDFAVNPNNGERQSRQAEWAHGVVGKFVSGFTQGTVGFGVDAHAILGIKLDGGNGLVGNGVGVPGVVSRKGSDFDGKPQDEFSKLGGALKARIHKTELHYGDVFPSSPVLAASDIRLLPQSLRGWLLKDATFDGLALQAGKLESSSDRAASSHRGDLGTVYGGRLKDADDVAYLGGSYQLNDNWAFKLHTSRLDNVWNQSFARVDFTQQLGEKLSWDTGLNYYRTRDTGRALLGAIDNDSWSTHLGVNIGHHRLLAAYSQIRGDQPFDYVWNTYDLQLDNASQISDFNNPNERSWQAAYTYDFAGLGVPGLSVTTRYLSGDNIDGRKAGAGYAYFNAVSDGKHWERNVWVTYTLQNGPAKDLAFKVFQATHRTSRHSAEQDVDQLRLIVEYPLDLRLL